MMARSLMTVELKTTQTCKTILVIRTTHLIHTHTQKKKLQHQQIKKEIIFN